jgi:hypothetical protein
MDEEKIPTPEAVAEALAPEEELTEIKMFDTPEEQAVAKRLLPIVAEKIRVVLEADYAKRLKETVEALKDSNTKMITTEIEKIRAENGPPNPEQLGKLLSQEYQEFEVNLTAEGKARHFVIKELPQFAEMQFLRTLQRTLVPHIKELSSVEWTSSGTTAEKIQRLIDIVPEAMDMVAELAATSLDPFGEQKIDKAWVQKNLSSFRIMSIVEAQVVAGRFRDFFYSVFRNIPGLTAG